MLPERLLARWALVWLIGAAFMGVWLRWQQWGDPPLHFNFRYLTHAHSHLMFLGWVFNALAAGITLLFAGLKTGKIYTGLIAGMQVAVAGMALAFPFQGYAAVSILFSTLHMALAAWMAVLSWRAAERRTAAGVALRWAVVFMFISALGPFGLAYVMSSGLQDTSWYKLAVYFYLHFQYNGWMLMALLAIGLKRIDSRSESWIAGVHLLASGVFLTFALSVLWLRPPAWIYWCAGLGALIQISGAQQLFRAFWADGNRLVRSPAGTLAGIALFAWLAKLLVQLGAILPGAGETVFVNRNWLIAYFHWVLIGVISLGLLALFVEKGWLRKGRRFGIGIALFLAGFVLTEVLLVVPGSNAGGLLAAALMMLAGLGCMVRWIK